jgi:hypothetical protein
MAVQPNTWSDISAISLWVQDDVYLGVRALAFMNDPRIVIFKDDQSGMNLRKFFGYNTTTAKTLAEMDDLSSTNFKPSALATLTPAEIGDQYFITDQRKDSDGVGDIMNDSAADLALSAAAKIQTDLLGDFTSFTGGTIGSSGTTLTWGHIFAAISVCRVQMKSSIYPLSLVLHEYQWHQVAKAASVAGATLAQAPTFTDEITHNWYIGTLQGNNVNVFVTPDPAMLAANGTDAYGAVFARQALCIDWRRPIRIEPQRDASRRGLELNMSGVYAHGVVRPTFGVQILSSAAAPTS